MTPRRGEVWWHEPPYEKPRPMLVITRSEAIDVLNSVLAVPVTSHIRDIATQVSLDQSDGMPKPRALALDNTGPIEKRHLTRRITALGPDKLAQVCTALALAVSC